MAKPNFILPNKPAIKAGSILSYNYTDDLTFAAEPLDFSRNSSATRVNEQGLIEEVGYFGPQLVQNGDFSQEGPELVTNGDFSTDSNWTKGAGWTISGGKANANTTGNFINLYQNSVFIVGKTYKTTFTITDYTQGSIRLTQNGYDVSGLQNAVGTYTAYFTASQTGLYMQGYESFIGSIDNVSVKEVGQDWTQTEANWSFGNNKAIADGTSQGALQQSISTVAVGSKYKINYTISDYVSGNIRFYFGGVFTDFVTSNGIYSKTITATFADTVLATSIATPFTGAISNISVTEVIGDKPRIDYSDSSTEPSLLLEPQSTNLITYSEDFANAAWSKIGNTVVTSNTVISPNGTLNGSTVSGLSGTGTNDLRFVKSENTANNTYTYSVYLKGSGTVRIQLSNGIDQGFDDTITLTSSWKRHFLTCTFNSTTTTTLTANLDDLNGQTATQFDIWGAQLEQLSYATSYIPTSGSTATRLGETANNAGGAGVFNSEEGVLYAEIAALADDLSQRVISLSDGTTNERIVLLYHNSTNRIRCYINSGGSFYAFLDKVVSNEKDFHKIAYKYKSGETKLFVDGSLVNTSTATFSITGLDVLQFANGLPTVSPFYGKTKNIQVFNYALTDEELQTLTT